MARFKVITCANPECGNTFVGYPSQKYCCVECRKADHANPLVEKVCPYCNQTFTTRRTDKRFCCNQHKKAWEREQYEERKPVEKKVCAREGCNVEFIGTAKQKYCCRECARLAKKH